MRREGSSISDSSDIQTAHFRVMLGPAEDIIDFTFLHSDRGFGLAWGHGEAIPDGASALEILGGGGDGARGPWFRYFSAAARGEGPMEFAMDGGDSGQDTPLTWQVRAWLPEPARLAVLVMPSPAPSDSVAGQIRNSEVLYRTVFDTLPAGVSIADTTGNIIRSNRAAEAILGLSKEEHEQRAINGIEWRIIRPDGSPMPPEEYASVRALAEQREIRNVEMGVIKGPGDTVWLMVNATPVEGLGVVIAYHDISPIRKAQEALAQSESQYQSLVNNIPGITYRCRNDPDWTMLFMSSQVDSITGYRADELIGNRVVSYGQLIHPDDSESVSRAVALAIENKCPWEVEYRVLHRDGSFRWAHEKGSAVFDASGQVQFLDGFILDITGKKQAELNLEREHNRLANIIEGTHVGTWEWNVQTGETVFNERWAEIIGYSLDEISPFTIDTWLRFAHPDDAKASGELLARHFSGELDYYEFESRMRHKDGRWIWVLDRGKVAEWSSDGKPLWMMGTHQDITTRKESDEVLRQSEERFRTYVDSSPLGVFVADPEGRYLSVNPSGCALTGWSRYELLSMRISDILMPEALPQAMEHFRTTLGSGYAEGVYKARRKDGSSYWLSVVSARMGNRDLLAYCQDVSSRIESQVAVHEASMRLTLAAKAGNVGIWDYDVRANSLLWDDQMFALYGISPKAFKGVYEAWRSGLHPADAQRSDKEIEAALRGEKDFNTEFRVVWPDGSVHHIRAMALVVRDDEGRAMRMIGTNWDITDQKRAQEEIQRARDQAEAASRAKSEFLANMSHEIRTPLNAIIGFTDLLRGTPLSAAQEQYVHNANVSGHALLGIINDILDFSKIESGMLQLDLVETNLRDLMESSIDIVNFAAGKKGLELILDMDTIEPGRILVDPVRLKQILVNLLSNAVKFTSRGEVELRVRHETRSDHCLVLHVSVRDTGIGIPPDQRDRLFKAFSQADSSTTRKFGGTGLGLIISELLARKMGSSISFAPNPEGGTTFSFSLVTMVAADHLHRTVPAHGPGPDVRQRALVVDDNHRQGRVITRLLASCGVEAETADSASAAVKRLQEGSHFDLVLCDYHMPVADGLSCARQIRFLHDPSLSTLPIILLHAASDPDHLHKDCEDIGIQQRLVKPVKLRELAECLDSLRNTRGIGGAPVRRTAGPPVEGFGPSQARDGTTRTVSILVAEDVPMNMLMMRALLGRIMPQARLIEAVTGAAALESFREARPDLIFMDVQMPDMDGLAATRAIRAIEADLEGGNRCPIVALTAGAFKEEQEKCMAAGMDDFLTKPVDRERIQEILVKYL